MRQLIVIADREVASGIFDCTAEQSSAIWPEDIQSIILNVRSIGEISMEVHNFKDMPYIANIGCAASHDEALGLSRSISCIAVKDKAKKFEPTYEEAYSIIYDGVRSALKEYDEMECCTYTGFCEFAVNLCEGFFCGTEQD